MANVRVEGRPSNGARRSSPRRRWRSSPTCRPGSAPTATPCWPPGPPGGPRSPRPAGSTSARRPRSVRDGDWRVPPAPPGLVDRRVEITGPTEPKMAINALNCGAERVAGRPGGREHPALAQRRRRAGRAGATPSAGRWPTPAPTARSTGSARTASCPRSCRARAAGTCPSGTCWWTASRPWARWSTRGSTCSTTPQEQLDRGSGPYFYLPKLEGHLEAGLWALVFDHAEQVLGLPAGSIRATMLIETIPAAFEMEEMLHALGGHATGLNAGRWDYLFSVIKELPRGRARLRPPGPRPR